MKSILLLGSGLMAESVMVYLLANPRNRIHVASNILEEARRLAERRCPERCTFSEIKVEDGAQLRAIVFTADVVVSYVPAALHIHVARACLEVGRHMVTASYISGELEALDGAARAKGLVFLNEMGLDPGIDHLATMKVVDEVRERKGRILEYESWCGGLPSPACCDNPLGYKFTWSPIGAFRALNNRAVYLDRGAAVHLHPADLLYASSQVRLNQALTLEGYPNRDSLSYREVYGLHDATRVLRGTLRYPGFTELVNAFKEVGYFSEHPAQADSWLELTRRLLAGEEGSLEEQLRSRTVGRVRHYSGASQEENGRRFERILRGLKFFGLLSEQKIHDRELSALENLVKLLEPRLALKAGETDLVAMQHRFVIELEGRRFLRKSSLIEIGDRKGFSAMSLTVGLPTAIAAELVLQERIQERGVLRPVHRDIYLPALALLEQAGVRLIEEDEEL